MITLLRAAAGAAFTGTVSLTLGLLILSRLFVIRPLALKLTRLERCVFGFMTGSAALGLAVFVLTAVHLAYTLVFVISGGAVIAAWIYRTRTAGATLYDTAPDFESTPGSETAQSRLPKAWLWFALVIAVPYALLYISHALGPEYSSDGTTYHLDLVARYLRQHHFPLITTNMFSSFPGAIEMLFLVAFSIGNHSAAASTHLLFLFATAAALIGFGGRFQMAKVGIAAAVLFFLSPITGLDASSAYVDVAEAGACFCCFYAVQIWLQTKDDRVLVLAGAMAGFAGAIKYTGLIALPLILGLVFWRLRHDPARLRRCTWMALVPALVLIAPWMIKNVVEVGNPISPFANWLFPNPYVHISFEHALQQQMAHWNGVTWPEIPWEAAVLGGRLGGILGPTFLLAPLALLAIRTPMGRQILLAVLAFGIAYLGNIGTRFLIPPLPFLSLAIAMGVLSATSILGAYSQFVLLAVLGFHAVICHPLLIPRYAAPSWHIDSMHWDETIRRRPEAETLSARLDGYEMARFIDMNLAADARIVEVADLPRAYARQVIDSYYGNSVNEKMYYAIFGGVLKKWEPSFRRTFHFAAHRLKSVRIEQTGRSTEVWALSELRFFYQGRELNAQPGWHSRAKPFPWDIALAFDRNPITEWKAWQSAQPGMFVAVDFGSAQEIDSVWMDGPREQDELRFRITGINEAGKNIALATEFTTDDFMLPSGWRRLIGRELKAQGYEYYVMRQGIPGYEDIRRNPADWGMELVEERGNYVLCRLL